MLVARLTLLKTQDLEPYNERYDGMGKILVLMYNYENILPLM